MVNKVLAASRALLVLASMIAPSVALASDAWPCDEGTLSAPEFDTTSAGTIAAVVVGGAFLVVRRRKKP